MSITIKPHSDTKVISNIRATVVREFMCKVLRDQTEATLYGPNGELVDVLTMPLYKKWYILGYREFLEDIVLVNNKTGEFIILQNGLWKYAEHCKYRGQDDD